MAKPGRLSIATCQFPVSADIARNAKHIRVQMQQAKRQGAELVHFSETALSGYAGVDFRAWKGFDWGLLERETRSVMELAGSLKLWAVLGSSHRLTGKHRPHNSLYVITPNGTLLTRYDKRFCTQGDVKHFQSGDHRAIFTVNGVKCGLLICYEVRFPELYREYQRLGVQVVFHSFYNACAKKPTIHTIIMRPTLQGHSASNYLWISANNSSSHFQLWPSVLIQPDGTIIKSLPQHRAGVMTYHIDVRKKFYDASQPYRDRAMRGILASEDPVRDPRSQKLTAL